MAITTPTPSIAQAQDAVRQGVFEILYKATEGATAHVAAPYHVASKPNFTGSIRIVKDELLRSVGSLAPDNSADNFTFEALQADGPALAWFFANRNAAVRWFDVILARPNLGVLNSATWTLINLGDCDITVSWPGGGQDGAETMTFTVTPVDPSAITVEQGAKSDVDALLVP